MKRIGMIAAAMLTLAMVSGGLKAGEAGADSEREGCRGNRPSKTEILEKFDKDGDGELTGGELGENGHGGSKGENGHGGAQGKNGHGGAQGKNGHGGAKGENGHGGAQGKNGHGGAQGANGKGEAKGEEKAQELDPEPEA